MKIQISKFGEMLISRPSGKDAFLSAKSYLLPVDGVEENIELDFSGVNVLTPLL